jgi:hypothetical protein
VPSRSSNIISDNSIYHGSEGKTVSIAANYSSQCNNFVRSFASSVTADNEIIICNSNSDRAGFNIDTASSGTPRSTAEFKNTL